MPQTPFTHLGGGAPGSPLGNQYGQAGQRQGQGMGRKRQRAWTYAQPGGKPTVPNEPKQPGGNSTTGGKGQQPAPAGANQPNPQGGPFQMQSWYGGNPLQTAQDRATRALQGQLAQLRGQFGNMGLGNSSRSAIAQGTALGEYGTGLADVMAQRGLGAYESDANRALQANQQLANMGTGLTGIGSTEQQPPLVSVLMNLLSGLTGQDLISSFRQSGNGGYWT